MSDHSQLLSGVRVIESSLLGPGHVATFFADMGADVIKVEPPSGDYIRQMTWPIVKGVSLLHLHTHRGKRSVCLDLKKDADREVLLRFQKEAELSARLDHPHVARIHTADLSGSVPYLVQDLLQQRVQLLEMCLVHATN